MSKKVWRPVDPVDSGQLWRRKASGETHVIVACHGGEVMTRSVEGGFQGLEGDFTAAFERVYDKSERELMQPGRMRRRGMRA